MKIVVKRDGRLVDYDRNKILSAIQKANNQVCENERANEELIEKIILNIENIKCEQIPVESIQDIIEQKLMEVGKYVLAKTYIIYRYTRKLVRETNTTDSSILSLVQCKNKYVMEENSNKNAYLASTQRDLIAGEVSKDLTKRLLLPEKISKAHEEGVLHFHDADYFLQPIFNCFSRKTRFVTDEGVKAFGDCKDGEIVNVLDKDGRWRQAKVRNYGKKPMVKVTMTSGRSSKEIVCTANHRWILGDGTITTNLKVGDTLTLLQDTTNTIDSILPLLQNTTNTIDSIMTKQQAISFCIGFIIGDGSDHTSSSKYSYTFVRLCKEKIKYIPIFKLAGWSVSYPDSFQGDAQAIKKNSFKQSFLTSNSWKYMSLKDKQYLFMGYMAADGYKDRNGVGTTDERIECMIEDISALAGYHIASKRKIVHNTPYKKNATLTEYRFRKHQNINNHWIVKSIEPYRYNELKEAWCVEEPITHSFTLDGGVVTGNCCLINIQDMLDNGTVMSGKKIDPPKSFQVACTVMTQIIAAVASSQYGGQSVDVRHLGKYLRKSREKYRKHYTEKYGDQISSELIEQFVYDRLMKELKSGVQTIQYQINTLMTTNGQSPFVTLFLNLDVNDEYIEENALIIEEILKQRLEGIKNEKGVYVTPAFPKLIYVLDEHNCLKGGKYDYLTKLAVKCSSKRLYPDYISAKKMRENYEGNVFSCMGCRSFLSPWKDENGNYKFEGRFNQGVVSLNLPQIGIITKGDEEQFWKILEERLELCFEALMCRHKALEGITSDISPIHWQYGAIARLDKGEKIDKLLHDGYSTISLGYIGLYEVTKLMTGVSHTEPKGKEFALKLMKRLKEATDTWKKETGLGFGLYGTPAESLCYRFAKIDREKFGNIEDVTDKGYYTNSYHVDVREKIDAFSKFAFESQFQDISSGGAISYVEIPNMRNNLEALEDIVRFIYDNIQYAEFNTKSDYCHCCGFDGEILINEDFEWECPQCHNKDHKKMNVTRRTCGLNNSPLKTD